MRAGSRKKDDGFLIWIAALAALIWWLWKRNQTQTVSYPSYSPGGYKAPTTQDTTQAPFTGGGGSFGGGGATGGW